MILWVVSVNMCAFFTVLYVYIGVIYASCMHSVYVDVWYRYDILMCCVCTV